MKNLQKNQKGFTIIEVLIVLAIAGLIMVIVFLAVPALQRNSRNTQRTNDASKIVTALTECLANKNGQVDSCDTRDKLIAIGLDESKLQQLTPLDPNVTIDVTGPPVPPATGELNHANIGFRAKCNAAGDDLDGRWLELTVRPLYFTALKFKETQTEWSVV